MKSSDIELQAMEFENTQGTNEASGRPFSQTNSIQTERSSAEGKGSPADRVTERTPLGDGDEHDPAGQGVHEEARIAPAPEPIEVKTRYTYGPKDEQDLPSLIRKASSGEPKREGDSVPSPATAASGIPVDAYLFQNEIARRTYQERNDEFSENEIIKLCKSLNGRISHLSGHLIREKNRMRGLQQDRQQAETRDPADKVRAHRDRLLHEALGAELFRDLAESRTNARSSAAVDHSIRDGLDAWSIYCVHLAMTPIFFGLRLRVDDEVPCIIQSIEKLEPEMAQSWKLIRERYGPRDSDKKIGQLEAIRRLERLLVDDKLPKDVKNLECTILERIYRDAIEEAGPNHPLQIPLHWRALLHAHELQLDSYKDAISQTEKILRDGLVHIFQTAGVESPDIANNASLSGIVSNIVRDAATLAKNTKTSVFSQNIEVVVVEHGETFDEATTQTEDEIGERAEVKCTVKFGLRATDSDMSEKWLLKPEVLLT